MRLTDGERVLGFSDRDERLDPRNPFGVTSREGAMAETAAYCSECYNTVARVSDPQVKAAESAGNAPMTKQGTCCKCAKATIVVYYEV